MTHAALHVTRRRALLLPAAGVLALLTGAARAEEPGMMPAEPAKAPGSGRSGEKTPARKAPAKTSERVDGVSSASERRRARKERREKRKARKALQGA